MQRIIASLFCFTLIITACTEKEQATQDAVQEEINADSNEPDTETAEDLTDEVLEDSQEADETADREEADSIESQYPPPCVAINESDFPRPCTEYLDEIPCSGPYWPIDTFVGTSSDGLFSYSHILGTGNYICDPLDTMEEGNYDWRPVRGPDFGTIDDDGLMSMVLSTDDFSSDGGIFMAHGENETFRTFRREDGLPCQNIDVSYTHNFLTFGEPSMTGKNFFVNINYRCDENGRPGCEQFGTQGMYYYDHEKREVYLIVDNRTGLRLPDPESYEAAGINYECPQIFDVPVSACEDQQRTCHWIMFEGFPGTNDRNQLVVRGSYTVGDIREHSGIFMAEKKERDNGEVWFDVKAVLATDEEIQVPGQPDGTWFASANKPWINDQGVIVFAASFEHSDTDATQGLFAAVPQENGEYQFVSIAHNGSGSQFVDFDEEPEGEDLSRFSDRVVDPEELSTFASIDLVSNNGGVDGLGNVFFAAGFRDGDVRRKGVFMAEPNIDSETQVLSFVCGGVSCTGETPLVRSGEDGLPGTELGFVLGSFHSFSVNDHDQMVFKAMSEDRLMGIVLFYDGSNVHHVLFEDHLFPPGFTDDFWYIIGNYALNNNAQFMFRISAIWSNPDPEVTEVTTAWAVWRAEYQSEVP